MGPGAPLWPVADNSTVTCRDSRSNQNACLFRSAILGVGNDLRARLIEPCGTFPGIIECSGAAADMPTLNSIYTFSDADKKMK